MAGESENRRVRSRRTRAANVAGGRPHRHIVRLSEDEETTLTARAEQAGMSLPRLLVESSLGAGSGEAGRAEAVAALLDLDAEIRRTGSNLNQLTRYSHQERELASGIENALVAVARACLSVDATARWVMGKTPAVSAVSVGDDDLVVDDEWPPAVDPYDVG